MLTYRNAFNPYTIYTMRIITEQRKNELLLKRSRLEKSIAKIDGALARYEKSMKAQAEKQHTPELLEKITDAFVKSLQEMWLSQKHINAIVKSKERTKAKFEHRVCNECGSSYMPTSASQRFCSVECRTAYNEKQKLQNAYAELEF